MLEMFVDGIKRTVKRPACVRGCWEKTLIIFTLAVALIALFALPAMAATISGGTVDLPETGQTTCYDAAGTVIACAGTGQDGALQSGVSWPSPRFTDNGDGTVADNLTGLVWLKNANCANAGRPWATALTDVASLNSAGTMNANNCGDTSKAGSHQTDWRLPNMNEIKSLVNAEQADPGTWLNAQGFTSVQSSFYWSGSSFIFRTDVAWFVSMFYGGYVGSDFKFSSYYIVSLKHLQLIF